MGILCAYDAPCLRRVPSCTFHVLDRLHALVVDGVDELQRDHVGRLHLSRGMRGVGMGARDDAMCHVTTSGVFTLPSFFLAPQK